MVCLVEYQSVLLLLPLISAAGRSEEQRLEVSRALIDFQMETNEAKQEWANIRSVYL